MTDWTHRVILDGTDITERSALGVMVDEGEGASTLCDFVYWPASGVQAPDGLHLNPVVIDVSISGGGWQTLFTGNVIRPEWDQRSRRYRIRASNRIQAYFKKLGTEAAVRAALPGCVYSEALFGEPRDDLWEYAQKCMETLEQDVHIDRSGALEIIDWAAKGTPDHAITAAEVHNNGAFSIERADADQLINQVLIEYQYRLNRHKVRSHRVSWSAWNNNAGIDSWCEWVIGSAYQFALPFVSLAESVLLDSSWHAPGGLEFSTHPETGANLCATPGWVWINPDPESGDFAVTFAAATGYRAFGQTITETYVLTVNAAAAQGHYGTVVLDRRTGAKQVDDDPNWPPQVAQPQPGWSVDAIGDSYDDQGDEPIRTDDLQAGYQWAGWRIRGALRATSLRFRTDLRPDITLADTLSVTCFGATLAAGKVRSLRHVLDAAPYTEVSVAVSRGNGGNTDAWSVPARPDTSPGYAAPPSVTFLNTYVGGFPGVPAQDPDWMGWTTNANGLEYGPDEYYDSVFRVEWPEIEQAAVDEFEASQPTTQEIAVPMDSLVLN